MKLRFLIAIVAVLTLCTCVDPYTPNLKGYQPLLVIDGMLTDANSSYKVILTRTFQEQISEPESVTGATVFITDDIGTSSYLSEAGNGVYKTDSIEFQGAVGRTYTLHVQTKDGQVYESEPCLMLPVPDIDSIYYQKDQELINNATSSQDGIRIYVDSKKGDNNQYYRWAFDETWKFKVPTPKRYNYINDTTIILLKDIKDYCYKSRESDEILINSSASGGPDIIKKQPIFFIASDQSDRLLLQYSILVKQYSISKKEFDFWNNMQMVNESGSDIFAKMPFTVTSNIRNINNAKERVLGYFQVSAEKQKRKFIPFSEIVAMDLPMYNYPCEFIQKDPSNYPVPWGMPYTWNQLYAMFCVTGTYYFVEPIYVPASNKLLKLVFARPECANCELTGYRKKPDFWVDLK